MQIVDFVFRNFADLLLVALMVPTLVLFFLGLWLRRKGWVIGDAIIIPPGRYPFGEVKRPIYMASILPGWDRAIPAMLFMLGLMTRAPVVSEKTQTALLSLPQALCSRSGNATLLLFLHGWNGDDETWRKFPDLACGDARLGHMDVMVVNYPTFMVRRDLRIPQLATWLFDELSASDIAHRYSKIAVIAHSMGGLVARELVIQARLASTRYDPFAVLIEIGTPHDGANGAALATALGLTDRRLVDEMAQGSQFLTGQHDHWNRLSPRPATYCYTSPHDKVVREESATAYCEHLGYQPQWDHRELVKPERQDDPRYALPMAVLTSAIQHPAP